VTVRGLPAPPDYRPGAYWEARAQRFAGERDGLAAVCSYGMPEFYNRAIDREQRRALAPWLNGCGKQRVLDVGCGVGRWSRRLAAQGAEVLGIDLSPTMVGEARRRTESAGLSSRCRFEVADVATLERTEQFDLVLAVTVLQHIIDGVRLAAALRAMRAHLRPGGSLVLLEAAPARATRRLDSTVFRARPRADYLALAARCGLELLALRSVDPAPFRAPLLPHLRSLPALLGWPLLALATGLSSWANRADGPQALARSWHLVFAFRRGGPG
jgi:SAM-dependent methyltransferase